MSVSCHFRGKKGDNELDISAVKPLIALTHFRNNLEKDENHIAARNLQDSESQLSLRCSSCVKAALDYKNHPSLQIKTTYIKFRASFNDSTALHLAAREGRSDILAQLIRAGNDINSSKKWGGNTPLHEAVQNEQLDALEQLIHAKADLNAVNWQKKTALHDAVCRLRKIHFAIIDRLIALKAKLNARDNNGETALFYAKRVRAYTVIEKLIAAGADNDLNPGSNKHQW